MVISCVAYNCTNRQNTSGNLLFHRFPLKNKEVCMKWIIAVRRKNWSPSYYSRLCSAHFKDEDYRCGKPGTRRKLYDCAVPSIFNFPDRLKPNVKKRRILLEQDTKCTPKKRKVSFNQDVGTSEFIHTLEKETQTFTQNKDKQTQTFKDYSKLETTVLNLHRKFKVLQRQVKQRDEMIDSLTNLLESVKDKVNLSEEMLSILNEKFEELPFELTMVSNINQSITKIPKSLKHM